MIHTDSTAVTARFPEEPTETGPAVFHGVALDDPAVFVSALQDNASQRPVNRRRFLAKTW